MQLKGTQEIEEMVTDGSLMTVGNSQNNAIYL